MTIKERLEAIKVLANYLNEEEPSTLLFDLELLLQEIETLILEIKESL